MEQREIGAELKALTLISEFAKKFRFIDYTLHPGDIPGHSPGKSSNLSWVARKMSERYPSEKRRNVIFTVMDGMSCPGSFDSRIR
jgi:hypothetical protein